LKRESSENVTGANGLLNQLTVCIWTKETSRVGSPLDEAGRLFTRLRAEVGPPSPLALCKEGRIGEQKNPYGSHHQPQHISPTRRLGPFDMSQSVTFPKPHIGSVRRDPDASWLQTCDLASIAYSRLGRHLVKVDPAPAERHTSENHVCRASRSLR
jgi:hypothetical protein